MTRNSRTLQAAALEQARQAAEHDLVQLGDILQFLQFLRRRKGLILLGLLIGLALGAAYYFHSPPVFESKAQLLVMEKRPRSSSPAAQGLYYVEDDVATHMSLIQSPWFVGDVLSSTELQGLLSLADKKDPVRAVISNLSVSREKRDEELRSPNSVLNLSYQGTNLEECPIILNAVIERYRQVLNELSQDVNRDALDTIAHKAEEVQEDLAEKEAAYQQFRKEAPVVWSADVEGGSSEKQLADIESRKLDLGVRRAEIQARLEMIKNAARHGLSYTALKAITPETSSWKPDPQAEQRLFTLLLEEKALLKDFGSGHPDVEILRDQIKLARELAYPGTAIDDPPSQSPGANPSLPADDLVEPYVQSLEQELRDIEASERLLAEQCEQTRKQAKEMELYEFRDRQFQDEITRLAEFHGSLIAQLRGVDLNKDLVGYNMRVIAPVDEAVQVAPRALLVFSLTAALGIVLGLGLGGLADTSDTSFRSMQEIRERLGLPVIGYVPLLRNHSKTPSKTNGQQQVAARILCTHFQPHSAEAEAYRAVRATLCSSVHGQRQKLIQITSPSPDDGKTSLAANLAVSMAQSGKKVLLIDADLRRPHLQEVFDLPATTAGLTSVVSGETEPPDAVQKSGIPGLWLLPAGHLPSNPADFLASSRLKEFLDHAKEAYDLVLVDTSPLLAVADAREVASYADGVLLAIRLPKNSRPQVERVKEILIELGANLLGAVVSSGDPSMEFQSYGHTYGSQPGNGRGHQSAVAKV